MIENFNLHCYRQELELSRLMVLGLITIVFCLLILGLSGCLIIYNYKGYSQQSLRNKYLLSYYQNLPPINDKVAVIDHSMLILEKLQKSRLSFINIFNKIGDVKNNLVILNKVQFDNKKIVMEGEELIETASANFILSLQNTGYFKNVMLVSLEKTHFVISMERT